MSRCHAECALIGSRSQCSLIYRQIMFLNGFYLFAGCGTMVLALIFVADESIANLLHSVAKLPLDERIAKMILSGASIAVGFYVS